MRAVAASGSVPGTNPDRACFTSVLEAARDQVIAAQGITGIGGGRCIGVPRMPIPLVV